MNFDSYFTEFCSYGPTDIKSVLVQAMAWHKEGNMPSPVQRWPSSLMHYGHQSSKSITILNDIHFNTLGPGRFELNFRLIIFKLNLIIDVWGISCEVIFRWMSLDLNDDIVNIGSGNGLVPSGNKPLPEPNLTQLCCHTQLKSYDDLISKTYIPPCSFHSVTFKIINM